MINYYKKVVVKTVDDLCEAIHYSLLVELVNVDSIEVYYHVKSMQIRIAIKYADRCIININLEREEYKELLDVDKASQFDYDYFIFCVRQRIETMILKNYIK